MIPPAIYCLKCATLRPVQSSDDPPRPCRKCGAIDFGTQPPLHTKNMSLTDADIIFLKCQGIKAF